MARALLVALAFVGVLVALAIGLGWRFEWETQSRVGQLQADAAAPAQTLDLAREIAGVPASVQRYFRASLTDGMPLPRGARLAHSGEFLLNAPDGWVHFVSVEHFAANPPGFVWDARMDAAPGLKVKVRDAFVAGRGEMQARLWGVVPVVDVAGTPDIAQGALVRYLAEAPWFPVALLPSRGVRWSALDDRSARATLTVGNTTAVVDFFFNAEGLPERIYCAARMRDVDGQGVPTPWQGHFREYSWRGGMRVPTEGEVGWLLPSGEAIYWRGRVTDARYE